MTERVEYYVKRTTDEIFNLVNLETSTVKELNNGKLLVEFHEQVSEGKIRVSKRCYKGINWYKEIINC